METKFLLKILLAAILLAITFAAIGTLLVGKGGGLIEAVKNTLRFGT
jgi:ABC-type Mn2+/Zn2+ transport system permease subunit